MKLFLVNDQGHRLACLEDIERYDGRSPRHVLAILDFVETLIATAKGAGSTGNAAIQKQTEIFHV